MKRFQSMIFASLLTLAISATAFAGDIHCVVGDGDDPGGILGYILGSIVSFVAQTM